LKILSTQDINVLASQICCSEDNQKCMYWGCETCGQLKVPLKDHDPGLQVTWKKWTTRRVEKMKKGENGAENIHSIDDCAARREWFSSVVASGL
jgi:hypothetical protein